MYKQRPASIAALDVKAQADAIRSPERETEEDAAALEEQAIVSPATSISGAVSGITSRMLVDFMSSFRRCLRSQIEQLSTWERAINLRLRQCHWMSMFLLAVRTPICACSLETRKSLSIHPKGTFQPMGPNFLHPRRKARPKGSFFHFRDFVPPS